MFPADVATTTKTFALLHCHGTFPAPHGLDGSGASAGWLRRHFSPSPSAPHHPFLPETREAWSRRVWGGLKTGSEKRERERERERERCNRI